MRHTASPTRTWTPTQTHRSAAVQRVLRLAALFFQSAALCLILLSLATFAPGARAQTQANAPFDLGMTFTQQRSKFVGSSASDYFYLRGATVDLAYSPFHGIGPVVSLNGLAVTNLRTQIDIHQASFLGGGRYTWSLGHISPTLWTRRGSIFGEGLVGLTHATDGYYPTSNFTSLTSTASGFTYAFGGGINYNLYHRFELRVMSHYFVSELPNGGTKKQENIKISAGVNWHFGN